MGAYKVEMLNLPDNRFDSIPLLEIVQRVESAVREHRPDTIYTHHEGDLNIDHELACRAVLTAARPSSHGPVRRIYSFEVPSSTEWRGPNHGTVFLPVRYIDITSTFDRKLRALRCYAGEMRPFPHPRSTGYVRALALKRGGDAGLRMAEAFMVLREIDDARGGV